MKGGDIVRTPGLQFPNGLHIQISEKYKIRARGGKNQSSRREDEEANHMYCLRT